MTSVSDKFICSGSLENNTENEDPLCGLGVWKEDQFYYLNTNVFAEPLEPLSDNINTQCSEFRFYDAITVETTAANRKKYHIPIEDPLKAICPNKNCNKQFSSLNLLKCHIRKVHCVEYKHMCEVCGRKFSAEYLLVRHMMVHDKKTNKCTVCGKILSGRTNMSVHLRTHTDSKPHECDICKKSFVRKHCLNLHVKFVHNKDMKCEKCGKRFPKRFLLARRMSASHKDGIQQVRE